MRAIGMSVVAAALLASTSARAFELEATDSLRLEVHGFVSQGAMLSTANNWLARSRRGSFEFTDIGLNFTMPVQENLRAGIQLFSRDLGPLGNYSAKVDWAYLDYQWKSWLGFRAGRVKIPYGLYNEGTDADSSRVAILPPQSMYPLVNRDYLLAQTGLEIYGFAPLGDAGELEYELYGGTIYVPTEGVTAGVSNLVWDAPYILGGRLIWETPLDGLRAGASFLKGRIDSTFDYLGMPASIDYPTTTWAASAEYATQDLLLAAEYSRWYIDLRSSFPTLGGFRTQERAYASGSYRFTKWFQPGAYYSMFFLDTEKRTGRENYQHDVAATLRFDVNPHWIWKLEGHYLIGTGLTQDNLNEDVPAGAREKYWGMFLIRTTAYF